MIGDATMTQYNDAGQPQCSCGNYSDNVIVCDQCGNAIPSDGQVEEVELTCSTSDMARDPRPIEERLDAEGMEYEREVLVARDGDAKTRVLHHVSRITLMMPGRHVTRSR